MGVCRGRTVRLFVLASVSLTTWPHCERSPGPSSGELGEHRQVIGPDGGVVATSTGASVIIPEGALDNDVEVGVSLVVEVPELAAGLMAVGEAYAFTPHGTRFLEPVTIRLPTRRASSAVLRLDDSDDDSWEAVELTSSSPSSVEIETTRFSVYMPADSAPDSLDGGGGAAVDDAGIPDADSSDAANAPDSSGPDAGTGQDAGMVLETADCAPDVGADWLVTELASAGGDFAITVDRQGHAHVVVLEQGTAHYQTKSSGTWVETEIATNPDAPFPTSYASIATDANGAAHLCAAGEYWRVSG